MKQTKIGVLLVNLGTPDQPTPTAVKRYLREFLSDPRVVDLPRWKWLPLLNTIILPLRSKRVAKNYQSIWTEQGSPLLAITQQQQLKLQQYFNQTEQNVLVEIGMTYGNPSLAQGLEKLLQQQVDKILVLPLYPQYSSTTTGAVLDAFNQAIKQYRGLLPFEFIHSYHDHPSYIQALAESINPQLQPNQLLLFSFHGIPQRYVKQGDYYPQHCHQTASKVAQQLGLQPHQWKIIFQSRFGKEEWLQPYTDEFLAQASKQGIEHIAVVCPGFASDCLETLEEIAEENREIFLQSGGKSFNYIPCLNAENQHIQLFAQLIQDRI